MKSALVPYPSSKEKGTVRGVHGRKVGAIWVEYLGSTTLYKVARHLLFPTPEEAKRHRQDAQRGQGGKRKPKTPPTDPDKNPNPPTEPTTATNLPSGPIKMWDPATGSHEVRGPT